MEKSITVIPTYIVIVMCYCLNFIQFFLVFNNLNLSSIFFMMSFLLSLALIFFTFVTYFNKKHKLLIIASFLVIAAIVPLLINLKVISFDYLNKFIFLMQTILLLSIVYENNILHKEKICKHLEISIFLQLLLFVIAYFMNIENLYLNNKLLIFNYSNPNFLGFHLLLVILTSLKFLSNTYNEKKYIRFLINIILITFNIFFLYKTGCRSALIALVLYFLIILLRKVLYRFNFKVLSLIIVLTPFIVIGLYYLINNTGLKNIFTGLIDEGKPLDSRIYVWNEGFDIFIQNPLFGNYYYVLYNASFSQLHNIYVDLFASYGLITGTITLIALYYLVKKICYISFLNKNIKVIAFLIAILFFSSFEATLFTGNNGFNIIFFSYLFLLR